MYSESLLAVATVRAAHTVCQRWVESLGPLTCPRSRPDFSAFCMKNKRRKMEDRHSICLDINTLYGIKVREGRREREGGNREVPLVIRIFTNLPYMYMYMYICSCNLSTVQTESCLFWPEPSSHNRFM